MLFNSSNIGKLSSYTSALSLMFFIGAVWFDFVYYGSFGIDIFSYISISEIITTFIGYIPFLILLAGLLVLYIFILTSVFEKTLTRLTVNSKTRRVDRLRILNKSMLLSTWVLLAWLALVMGPPMVGAGSLMKTEAYYFMRLAGTLIFLFLLLSAIYSRLQEKRNKMYLLIFVASFYFCIYYFATYRLWEVRHQPKATTQIEVSLKNGTILNTDDSLVFVGKTIDYLFLYHNSTSEKIFGTRVIKMEDVANLKILKYVRWARLP